MIPSFTKVHNKFKLNNAIFNRNSLRELAYSYVKEGEQYQKQIGDFLLHWLDDKDYIYVKTSGSTGKPKRIKLQKQAMVNSAIATGNYFNLKPGDNALHCLPVEFIAGKMMLVRAMILGLELDVIEPSSNPMASNLKSYDFCAMVPLQLENSVDSLDKIKTLIVGGAAISKTLQDRIQESSCKLYATYGMTETVSHIAVRSLNDEVLVNNSYNLLPNVSISKDDRDCLVINAPLLAKETIITNDIVEISSETSFKLLGRFDNVINSGGVKLFPEQIEAKLKDYIDKRFFVSSMANSRLGEQLIMVIESNTNHIDSTIFANLETFEKPKQIYNIERFVETDSGKIQRSKTLALLK